eukprot:INCI4956.1.p1 GENE.INCI4956.1~~INCI4956.1.p1  ORF type:complete len:396 (-),score=68.95 INCI4956.1:521-1708(-)
MSSQAETRGFLSSFGGPKGLFGGFVDEENGIFGYTPAFYAVWIPAAFLALATALSPKGVAKKFFFWARGVSFFWLYNEKKGMSKAPDTATLVEAEPPSRKTIIFIRHGESDWNEIFNKNKLLLLPRLVWGIVRETLFLPTSHSVFIDSPLSKEGIGQAITLRTFLTNYSKKREADRAGASAGVEEDPEVRRMDRLVATLNGEPNGDPSLLVTSNLRRAINTGCVAMWNRLRNTKERIILLDSLQEMSRNVDTNALAGPGEYPEMSVVQRTLGRSFSPAATLDASQSTGNKGMFSKALPRMEKFNNWCFGQQEPAIVISSGHSLWIMNYFRTFLPKASTHVAKTNKVVNCGAVAFDLVQGKTPDGKIWHKIDEASITVIHGGFKMKKGKGHGKKSK